MGEISRRRLLALSAALLAAPRDAAAQQKVYRIGFLGTTAPEDPFVARALEAVRQGLREQGWVEGQSVTLEYGSTKGDVDLLPELAADFVRARVDVIVAGTTSAAVVAKKATSTIPIVFAVAIDPVAVGLVASLARPGGNVTGVSYSAGPEIASKVLQLLKEAAPRVTRVAVLSNPANAGHPLFLREAEVAARALGVGLRAFEARAADGLDEALAALSREYGGGLVVLADVLFFSQRARLAAFAARHRMPAIYGAKEHAEAGGLMAYAPSGLDNYRRAGIYAGKILRGARPADLPVEQPTRFELVINMKTARALGLTIPPALLLSADQVIE